MPGEESVPRGALPRGLGAAVLGLALLLAPAPAFAYDREPARDPSVYAKAVDLVVVRPLGLVPIAFGLVMLPLAYPATWLTEGSLDVPGVCLGAPLSHTFRRPLGEL